MIIANTNALKHLNIEDACDFLGNAGFNTLEITTDGKAHAYPYIVDEPAEKLVSLLKCKNMTCKVLSGGWGDFATGNTRLIRSQINLAKALNSKSIRFFFSNPHIPIEWTVENYMCVYANIYMISQEQDVNFCFENHGGLFNDFDKIHSLFQDIGSVRKNIGITYDPVNFITEGVDPYDALKRIIYWVKHVHVKDIDQNANFVSVGDGITPWEKIIKFLNYFGYSGDYSVEFEGTHSNQQKETGLLKSLNRFGDILK